MTYALCKICGSVSSCTLSKRRQRRARSSPYSQKGEESKGQTPGFGNGSRTPRLLPPPEDKFTGREFQKSSSSAPKRLNDVAQAPPEFKKLPRVSSAIGRRDGVPSMSQKNMMEQEREKAIARYRELKASRRCRRQN